MRERWLAVVGAVIVLVVQGCASVPGAGPAQPAHPADPMLGMLHAHLSQLESNLAGLSKRIATLKEVADHEDPIIREIRALDIAGWEMHQQQWLLQRDHLRYAEQQLQRVKEHPEQKAQVLEDWTKHEREFETALENFRAQRHELERKRLQAEARLIERHFR